MMKIFCDEIKKKLLNYGVSLKSFITSFEKVSKKLLSIYLMQLFKVFCKYLFLTLSVLEIKCLAAFFINYISYL